MMFLKSLILVGHLLTCSKQGAENRGIDYWAALADSLQQSTYTTYLSANGNYYIQDNAGDTTFHYWWNAHALDVLVDGFLRTKDSTYLIRAKRLLSGMHETNGSRYPNVFYDDMLWLALASLRAYEAGGDPVFLDAVNILWSDIQTGINPHQGGGVAWRKDQRAYKNTPANAPAIILACRLYQHFGRASDLQTAIALYDWLKATLVDPVSGVVWDGINRQGDGRIDKDWLFTYNQGVFLGAAHALYEVTNKRTYLDDARCTADASLKSSVISPNGILRYEGQGDGGLFKGIFVRYLARLAQDTVVPAGKRDEYVQFIGANASAVAGQALIRPQLLVGPDWNRLHHGVVDLSAQLSGLMLIEAQAYLGRKNN
ncbi:glycoside hydrolase [Parapedobacter sp. ISTM3]|uniref:Predicted alpha-1,6-mannanase, GH76 family n=1 Tax=Parapedobacter luteus TaxID=623280 RepID=A0A1T5AJR3_9SPHI|nr:MULTISPECIES: glycoside hydrolase family 76 protein [Parapedobacter]MBK1441738.1 glycoside hydrolase [Parapedobacter sp. ISTM3]SKB35234.1 Predicted alpha-1,6-mannanase, GH76 family [Parapedobacter luteus]